MYALEAALQRLWRPAFVAPYSSRERRSRTTALVAPPPGLQPEDLVRAYILLKDKGILVEDEEDTAELLDQLQREKRKDLR